MSKNNTVVANLWKKKALLESGNPQHKIIKPLLLILGGGNLGIYSAGACYALHILGLGKIFDAVVGISTGAWVGGYYLSGQEQIKIGASIYYEEFATPEYITVRRFPYLINKLVIERTTSFGRKKLDIEAVQASASKFFVGVTDMCGKGHFLDAKKASPSFLSAMYASSATPLAYHVPHQVNGNPYFDGGIALAFPIEKVLEDFLPTDVLVLPNCPQNQKHTSSFVERVFIGSLFAHLPSAVRRKTLLRHEDFYAGFKFADKVSNVHVLWPPDVGIHSLSRDSQKLRKAAYASASKTLRVFGKSELEVELY